VLTLPAPVALTLNVVLPSPTASVTLAGQAAAAGAVQRDDQAMRS